MNWVREKRGSSSSSSSSTASTWDGSWRNQTLASISPPPFPLLALFFIIVSLVYYSRSNNTYSQASTNFKLFLVLLPLLIISLAHLLSKFESFANPQAKPEYYGGQVAEQQRQRWELPWGVLLMVFFLLLMVSFHPSFN